MYTLVLKLMMVNIITHAAFPAETVVLVFPTELGCVAARWDEAEKMMKRARDLSKELNVPVRASVTGGCKRPSRLENAFLPPESSGG